MAHPAEPMDIDSDFDNKENSYHHSNVLPCTEKGYEELDVSELNMKLRYSVTPASSPMSKSYTANCVDHKSFESGNDSLNNTVNENTNLTRSLNSSLKNDNVIKSLKTLPLQTISTEQFNDNNRSTMVLRSLDTTVTPGNANVTVSVSGPSDIDENLSLPSSSSSAVHTPEATTPTKEIPKTDEGSPIMRGLKSVLNMFRSSQSPIPPESDGLVKQEVFSPAETTTNSENSKMAMASTPISAHRMKETSPSKRNSPYKESIVFNEDLEKELQWKDETTILFSQERIPIHKLFFQQNQPSEAKNVDKLTNAVQTTELDSTVEYMDISYNDSILGDKTITDRQADINKTETTVAGESDSEFVDCETTFTKNESQLFGDKETPLNKTQDLTKDMTKNESTSKLKPIILNTTQDILNATLSITPEDIYPEVLDSTKELPQTSASEIINKNSIEVPQKLNETKVIGKVREHEENINETFGITSQIINTESDNLNVTKTIENITNKMEMGNIPNTIKNTDNLDVTKTIILEAHIERKSEEQTTAQNLNTTNSIENQPKIIDKLDVTKVIEIEDYIDRTFGEQATAQNLDPTNSNENQSKIVHDPDVTKTIEIDAQIDRKSEEQATVLNLDVTHTIENHPKIIDNLNVTKTIEIDTDFDRKSEESSPIVKSLDSMHTVKTDNVESQILTEQASHLNVTKSIENNTAKDGVLLAQATVQDLEPITIKNNATENKLIEYPIIESTGNLDNTNEYVPIDNKTEDLSNIPVLENNNMITEHEFAIEQVDVIEDIPHAPKTNNVKTVEETNKPIEENVNDIVPEYETQISLDDKPLELPADIPLPDDDDVDKELNITVENTANNIIKEPCNLPLNLVNDIKTKTGDSESIEEKSTVERDVKDVRLEILQTNVENSEKDSIVEVPACELAKDFHEKNVIETENVQNISESVHKEMLLKVIPLPDNLIIKDEKMPADEPHSSQLVNETKNIMEPTNNVTLQNEIQKSKPELDITLPMDINVSLCEYKRLPDIINQITKTCQDDIEQAIKGIELVEQPSPVEFATIGDNIGNITFQIAPVTEILTVVDNIPRESGDSNVCTKPENIDIPIAKRIAEDVPIASNSEEIMFIHDTIANMSIDEKVESSENINVHLRQDIITPGSVPSPAQSNDVSPKPETTLIHTPDATIGDVIIDEEVVASKNNSPFVCVMAEPETKTDNYDVEDSLATKTRMVCTPPASPPIASKGYNFNFDEYDDPFAANTNIRMSPTLDTLNKYVDSNERERDVRKPTMGRKEVNNRRKTQTERKRPPAPKKRLNSTFNSSSDTNLVDKPVENIEILPSKIANKLISETITTANSFDKEDNEVQDIIKTANKNIEQKLREALKANKEIEGIDEKLIEATPIIEKSSVDSLKDAKTTSSSEQSTYFSAGTSSSESIKSRNVFNLPEIDDMNFNPFATMSKMRQSPPLTQDIDNSFATKSKISSPDISLNDAKMAININEMRPISDDKMETELMEKDSSTNISNTTTSSKATDERDTTVREVNTEDEDTAEGPFLEVEDLHNDGKMTDSDTENDMMQFHEVPPQVKVENQDDELFIDAEAFEFLLNQNKSNTVVDSGKESLFLKFDPLFAKRTTSDGVLAALAQIQKRQSTPTKLTKLPQKEPISPIAGPSTMNLTHNVDLNASEEFYDDLNVTVSKPMMAVPPAVNPVTPRNKSVTPTRSNRRSVTFTSPAMAVIDRLLSLSANNSPIYDNTYTHVTREQNEANLALAQLRELLAEKEVHVYNLRAESKELKDRLSTMESQVRNLETESQTRLKKINDLNETLVEKTKINKSMALVVEEYERTIASLIAEIEQDKKRHAEEKVKLINERDEQTAHLASMEVSFSDLHSKYEKSKQVIFSCKANEDVYKKSLKEFEENVTKMQKNFDLLKQHATSKLNHANQELEKMNKAHEAEVLKLSAMIKRKELHITSLEETLAQKTKANEELTAICDELINKVG